MLEYLYLNITYDVTNSNVSCCPIHHFFYLKFQTMQFKKKRKEKTNKVRLEELKNVSITNTKYS